MIVWCGTCNSTNRAQDGQWIRRLAWPLPHVVRLGQTAGSSMWTCGQTSLNGRCVVQWALEMTEFFPKLLWTCTHPLHFPSGFCKCLSLVSSTVHCLFTVGTLNPLQRCPSCQRIGKSASHARGRPVTAVATRDREVRSFEKMWSYDVSRPKTCPTELQIQNISTKGSRRITGHPESFGGWAVLARVG